MNSQSNSAETRAGPSRASSASNAMPTSTATSTKHEGPLMKWTNVVRGWQYRWFVLDPVHCTLDYYLTEEDRGQSPRASIKLRGSSVVPSHEDAHTFILHAANNEVYKFKAHDAKERQKWVNLLRCVISPNYGLHEQAPASGSRANTWTAADIVGTAPSDSGKGNHHMRATPPRMVHFASEPTSICVEEPFAPARQIISKIRDKRSEMCRLIETAGDPAVAALCPDLLLLKASSLATWDCLHQCLFALMNSETPENNDLGIYDSAPESDVDYSSVSPSLPASGSSNKDADSKPTSRSSSLASPAPVDQLDHSVILPSVPTTPLLSAPPRAMVTVEERGRSLLKPVNVIDTSRKSSIVEAPKAQPEMSPAAVAVRHTPAEPLKRQDSRPPVFAQDEEEVSDLDEDDTEELGSVESEKSVILHLIGQLKIGMDLTKVTLPTFILERRSLLELFADYMGHAYFILRIPDMTTEEQRMLGVLEWYLTSFHIVRKGTQAKKPYNPIIGETFHCSWKVSDQLNKEVNTSSNRSAIPSGDPFRLKYVGEQVSHHPPVTAFYVECPEKKICMNASVYTQSKFYGLSIGVNMVGSASMYLVEHGEEYTFTLPSAYARSILTVPWCELGGKVVLECKKSGYVADIVFHTKPFYGGKLHKVTAEVTNSEGKVVCKVNGEWNAVLEFNMTSDAQQTKSIDVTSLPIVKKRCRPIVKQDPFESRRLWQKVTSSLAMGDIDKATAEKNVLEDLQRKDEKQRKLQDTRFPNKFFHLEDGTWMFNEPLHKRTSRSMR